MLFENSKVWKTLPLSSEDGIQINIGNETPLGKMNDVSVKKGDDGITN